MIYNIIDKMEYLEEVLLLEHNEWSTNHDNLEEKIKNKIIKVKNKLNDNDFCKLVLIDKDELIGFISIFPTDGDCRLDLTPWYATMYVKKEYRGHGYSKILNDAILKEAKKRGFNKIYLKSDLVNYYEKFGAKYIENLENGEKLYFFDIK